MQVSAFVRKMIKTNRIYQLKIKCHTEPAYRQANMSKCITQNLVTA